MKNVLIKLFSFFLFFFLFFSQVLIAQTDAANQEELIVKALTFEPLMEKVPAEVRDKISIYLILNHGVRFNFSGNFEIHGKKVLLINKNERIENMPFFDFFTLNIENNKADAMYYFTYYIDGNEHVLSMTIQFVKINSAWEVINYTS